MDDLGGVYTPMFGNTHILIQYDNKLNTNQLLQKKIDVAVFFL